MGYLISFLLKMLAGALGVGSLALLVGYFMMWTGLRTLRLYCSSFSWAERALYPMLAVTCYRAVEDLATLFWWDLPILTSMSGAVEWVEFGLIMIFHAALLSAIREIGMQVGLPKISAGAIRNMIVLALYLVVYTAYRVPMGFLDSVRGYFGLSVTLLTLVWIIADLALLLNCTKDIVAAGQEDPAPKRYKWEFLNRIGDRFEENFKKASDSNREAIEEHLRKKQEKNRKKKK